MSAAFVENDPLAARLFGSEAVPASPSFCLMPLEYVPAGRSSAAIGNSSEASRPSRSALLSSGAPDRAWKKARFSAPSASGRD